MVTQRQLFLFQAAQHQLVDGLLDGQAIVPIARGDRVLVGRHHTDAKFIGNPERSYWDTLVEKMRWAAPPSYRDRGA